MLVLTRKRDQSINRSKIISVGGQSYMLDSGVHEVGDKWILHVPHTENPEQFPGCRLIRRSECMAMVEEAEEAKKAASSAESKGE